MIGDKSSENWEVTVTLRHSADPNELNATTLTRNSTTAMDIDADSEIANLHNTPENTTSNRFRAIKNTLIGNPTAKAQLAISDPSTVRVYVSVYCFVRNTLTIKPVRVVHAINFPNDEDGLSSEKCQIEAAHLLASLTYGARAQTCRNLIMH